MRFGQALWGLYDLEWLPFHTEYDRLKVLLRKEDLSSFHHAFRDSVLRTETFYQQQLETLDKHTMSCVTLFKISPLNRSHTKTKDFTDLSQLDAADLFYRAVELFEFLEKLCWFGYLNTQIIENIARKAHKRHVNIDPQIREGASLQEIGFVGRTKCREALAHLNHFLLAFDIGKFQKSAGHSSIIDRFLLLSAGSLATSNNVSCTTRICKPDGLSHYLENFHALPLVEVLAWIFYCEATVESYRSVNELISILKCSNDYGSKVGSMMTLLHEIIQILGRRNRLQEQNSDNCELKEHEQPLRIVDHSFLTLISALLASRTVDINAKDFNGRTAFHHACYYNFPTICEVLLAQACQNEPPCTGSIIELILSEDTVGLSPLKLAIFKENVTIVQLLVRYLLANGITFENGPAPPTLDSSVIAASHVGNIQMMQSLVECGAPLNVRNNEDETLLHIAVRKGHISMVKLLCQCWIDSDLDLNAREMVHGHTPAIIACRAGSSEALDLLLDAGADCDISDYRGWKALDHAAFRGHLSIAASLRPKTLGSTVTNGEHSDNARNIFKASDISPSSNDIGTETNITSDLKLHKILVSMGSSNTRKSIKTVHIGPGLVSHQYQRHPDLRYRLKVQVNNATGKGRQFELPILENMINDPLVFESNDPARVQLGFALSLIFPDSSVPDAFIAETWVMLSELKTGLSVGHDSLSHDHTISLGKFASVTFNFTVIGTYIHPGSVNLNDIHIPSHNFWPKTGATRIIGHRGSGANTADRKNLQIGENTIQSFISAKNLGASCVEFDVQLTKDRIPVIFHDFVVSEIGGDIPLHFLNQEQFLNLSKKPFIQAGCSGMAEARFYSREHLLHGAPRKARSLSFDAYDNHHMRDIVERMKRTAGFKDAAIKGNLRGFAIQEAFPTLENLMTQVPKSTAFNIELKYPMMWEAEDKEMELIAFEPNLFVDTILSTIFTLAGDRRITFSSFSPEICILLRSKQSLYPILFLNKAGKYSTGDIRAQDMQQAIKVAQRWDLAGVVLQTDPLVMSPKLITYAHSKGLVVGSYGNMNDEPEHAIALSQAGLDAIIVNKVRLICTTLRECCHVAED